MPTSATGCAIIKAFETCKLRAYRCPAGVLTIGWGHTGPDVAVGMVITPARAEQLLRRDLARFEAHVDSLRGRYGLELYQDEYDALVSFAYNCGEANLDRASILTCLRRGDKAGAARGFLAWNRARVNGELVPLAGLTRRRRAEKALFEGDVSSALAIAGAARGPMPQKIEAPDRRKPLATSTTAIAASGSAIGGATVVLGQAQEAVATAQSAAATFAGIPVKYLMIGVGLAIIVAGVVILWRRVRYWRTDDKIDVNTVELPEDEDEPAIAPPQAPLPVEQLDSTLRPPAQEPVNARPSPAAFDFHELLARAASNRPSGLSGLLPVGRTQGGSQ